MTTGTQVLPVRQIVANRNDCGSSSRLRKSSTTIFHSPLQHREPNARSNACLSRGWNKIIICLILIFVRANFSASFVGENIKSNLVGELSLVASLSSNKISPTKFLQLISTEGIILFQIAYDTKLFSTKLLRLEFVNFFLCTQTFSRQTFPSHKLFWRSIFLWQSSQICSLEIIGTQTFSTRKWPATVKLLLISRSQTLCRQIFQTIWKSMLSSVKKQMQSK